jgi:lipoyl(octanoyl) transferase
MTTSSHSNLANHVIVRHLKRQDYAMMWHAMKKFTDARTNETPDEIWVLQHNAVFTQGQNGKAENILNPTTIPIVKSDRGGQVTYHAPGQLIIYTLLDVKRKKWNIRELISHLEQSVIQFLAAQNISAASKCKAPGIYVNEKKICSLGLRIRRGCSYHGLALNVDMDLRPFSDINPCGFPLLKMTQLADLSIPLNIQEVASQLLEYLTVNLGYNSRQILSEFSDGIETSNA